MASLTVGWGAEVKNELAFLTVAEASALLASGAISPVELTEHHLRRIEALDGDLHCFLHVAADSALDEAKAAQREFQQVDGAARSTGFRSGSRTITTPLELQQLRTRQPSSIGGPIATQRWRACSRPPAESS